MLMNESLRTLGKSVAVVDLLVWQSRSATI